MKKTQKKLPKTAPPIGSSSEPTSQRATPTDGAKASLLLVGVSSSSGLISAAEMRNRLQIKDAAWRGLVARGLPVERVGRRVWCDVRAVGRWLESEGEEELFSRLGVARSVARTYAELAAGLGMSGRQPERILQRWAKREGFPGRPGDPGKANGHFPIDEIREWIALQGGGVSAGCDDEELVDVARRVKLLELEEKEQAALERLGRLADVDEVAQFARTVCANAKAVLGSIEDELIAMLPAETPAETRRQAYRRIQKRRDDLLSELARLIEGDTDDTGEDDDAA